MTDASEICAAIRERRLLEFDYHGARRVVAPYCHGVNARGVEMLRAIQVAGESRSRGLGFGKLWVVSEIENLRIVARPFVANDPNYNPNDSAMQRIHCRV